MMIVYIAHFNTTGILTVLCRTVPELLSGQNNVQPFMSGGHISPQFLPERETELPEPAAVRTRNFAYLCQGETGLLFLQNT